MRADLMEVTRWANSKGFLVNNVCQLDSGGWRVNVRRKDWATSTAKDTHEFAEHETLAGALTLLVKRLGGAVTEDVVEPTRASIAVNDFMSARDRAFAILDRLAPEESL